MTDSHRQMRSEIEALFVAGRRPWSMRHLYDHLRQCDTCAAAYDRLAEVERQLCDGRSPFSLERVQDAVLEAVVPDSDDKPLAARWWHASQRLRNSMILTKLVAVTGVATSVTFALFFIMQRLIAVPTTTIGEDRSSRVVEFIRLPRESTLETKVRPRPERDQPAEPPPTWPKPDGVEGGSPAVNVLPDISPPRPDAGRVLPDGASQGVASDADTIPVVRIHPIYPRSAAERRIEGWVVVDFTIDVTGAVRDARVTASEPPGEFERAALRAVRRWKYKPRTVAGVSVEQPNVRVRLAFELEDESP